MRPASATRARPRPSVVALLLSLLAVPSLAAQEPLLVPRLVGPVTLDGRGDDAAWAGVAPLPMVGHQPTYGADVGERTEVRVAHDGTHLFVAARLRDAEPPLIRAQSLTRDRVEGDDHLLLVLDSFHDHESALAFAVTPAGTRQDAAITADAEGAEPLDPTWNGFWDARTARGADGWSAELRIPLSSLRFQADSERVVMGLGISRLIGRTGERHVFPAIPPTRSHAYLKPSLLLDAALEGVGSRAPLYLTPYAASGVRQSYAPDERGEAFRRDDRFTTDLGIDLKYGLTSNLTLDLTYNTDFAQVEADDQQVNVSRFSLFVPEKRPFFQERAGIFHFPLGGASRLFHSRRIGLSDDGQPIRIVGGARMVGRVGSWDVGVLDVHTAEHEAGPGENFGVVRVRRQVLNENSWVGALLTSRLALDGGFGLASGVDGTLRVRGNDYLTFNLAQTADDRRPLSPRGAFARAWLQRRTVEGLNYTGGIVYSGAEFDPSAGFELMDDYTYAGGGVGYGWIPGGGSPLRRHGVGTSLHLFRSNTAGYLESASLGGSWSFEGRSGSQGELRATAAYEDLRESFPLPGNARIPAGRHSWGWLAADLRSAPGRRLVTRLSAEAGGFYDGWRVAPRVSQTWYASPHLELSGEYEWNLARFAEREDGFTAHLARLRARTALDARWSATTLLQYSTTARRLEMNARLRYNAGDGSDLWLVYNEGLHADPTRLHPAAPRSAGRTLLLKYSHTLR